MFLKKRNAVAAMIVLFICVAVYLNWSYTQGIGQEDAVDADSPKILGEATLTNQEEEGKKEQVTKEEKEKSPKDTVANDYFTNARMEKQKARDSALNTLKETTNQENISQEARDKATASIETLATGAVAESRIETLVKAKGFTDCVALINEESVNVIVKAPEGGLTQSDTSKIRDIVVAEAKVKPSQIKIVEIK